MGWVDRAAMLVEGRPSSVATAFVPFAGAYMALLARHDPEAAAVGSAEARTLAREVGAVDLELLSLALEGLSLVAIGQVDDGMRLLDAEAAAAVGGEMSDLDSIETICCFVIDACKRVRDLERAGEWCLRVQEIATRFADRQMFAVCRTHYADLLVWHGEFARAEAELEAAVAELGRLRPGKDVDALVRLAELRRRQGRPGRHRAGVRGARRRDPAAPGRTAGRRGTALHGPPRYRRGHHPPGADQAPVRARESRGGRRNARDRAPDVLSRD
jgi:hypothetical protein